jgi:endonuclease III
MLNIPMTNIWPKKASYSHPSQCKDLETYKIMQQCRGDAEELISLTKLGKEKITKLLEDIGRRRRRTRSKNISYHRS